MIVFEVSGDGTLGVERCICIKAGRSGPRDGGWLLRQRLLMLLLRLLKVFKPHRHLALMSTSHRLALNAFSGSNVVSGNLTD
jgi:hypothetical protein